MASLQKEEHWVAKELTDVDFGDNRLKNRAIKVLTSLSDNPQGSIPESIDNWSELHGAYRFFDNEKVNGEKILGAHFLSTLKRCKDFKIVLVAHDTSSANYSGLKKTSGLGEVGNSKKSPNAKGLIMHTAYAVTPDRLALGLLEQNIWARETSAYKDPSVRNRAPIEVKESYKWLSSLQAVSKRVICGDLADTLFIHVMDREADIFDVFCEAKELDETFIIRAKNNRRVNKKSRGSDDGILMLESLGKSKPLGRITIEVPTKSFLEGKRQALIEVRAQQISVPAPRGRSMKDHNFKESSITLTVVSANEVPNEDVEEENLINWTLLTNVAIASTEQVLFCLDYYCCRWQIEVYHRILKTGCNVEKSRLSEAKKIKSYIAMMAIVAWHIHWLNYLAKTKPKASPDLVFTKQEQLTLSMLVLKKKPSRSATIKDYLILLGRLGGFIGRKGDGLPGAEVLWRGWHKLKETMAAMKTLSDLGFTSCV